MLLDREFPPDVRVENEIEILREEGVAVTLLAFTRSGRPQHETLANGVDLHRAPISSLVYKSSVACLKHPMYFNFWRSAVRRVLASTIVHAIHVHDLPLARVGREIADEIGVPMVLDLHENWPYMLDVAEHTNSWLGRLLSSPIRWRRYEREMVTAADAVVTVVDEMRSRIIALGADADRVVVYQNVPDQSMLEAVLPKVDGEFFTLLYAGGINIHRGLQVVLDAIGLSKQQLGPFKFRVLGDGRYLSRLRKQVTELDIERLVEFAGWVDQREVIRTLAEADLAIVPHLRNTQNDHSSPNKIFQYMLSGTAVITSDCLSLKRVVTETGAGLV
ncbi:MAG: glycosyltransferase, partial [Rhodothermales bacterium]|nr:glycosyltransferase [Rhodothermales bacterium]